MAGESEPPGIIPPESSNQGALNRGHERPGISNNQRQQEQSSEEPTNPLHHQAKVEAKDSSKLPPDQHLIAVDLNPEQEEKAVVLQIKQSRLLKRTSDFKEAKARGAVNLEEAENLAKDWVEFDAQRNAPGTWFLNKILGQPIDVKTIIDDILPGQAQRLFQEQSAKPVEEVDYHKEYQEKYRMAGAEDTPPESPDSEVQLPPELLSQFQGEVMRRLSKEEIDRAIKTGSFDTPDLINLRNLQNAIQRASQEKQEADLQLSEFNEQLAVRRTIGLVDVFYTTYNVAIHNAERRGLSFKDALEEGKKAVSDLVERQLAAIEEDDASVRSEDVSALQQAINITITDEIFRAQLARKAIARSYIHYGAFTSKYIGGEEWAKVPTNLLEQHVKEVVNTPGVRKAIELLESSDDIGIAGAYYRNLEANLPADDTFIQQVLAFKQAEQKKKGVSQLSEKQLSKIRQDIWVVNKKFELIQAARSSQSRKDDNLALKDIEEFASPEDDVVLKLGLYELLQPNEAQSKQNTPKMAASALKEHFKDMAKKANLEEGSPRQQQLINLLYDTNRAFELGIRLHHMTGMSAMFDGPRWKEGKIIPEKFRARELKGKKGYEKAEKGQLVLLDPVIEWDDPGDPDSGEVSTGKIQLHLRTVEQEVKADPNSRESKIKKRTLESLKGDPDVGKRYLISAAWTKAYQEFYRDCWDLIDFKASARSGRAARMANRILNFPIILEHPGEVHAGKAKFLRRFAYLGVPSLSQMSAHGGLADLVDNWDSQFRIMKEGWVGRLNWAEKLKSQINRKEPDILNSTKNLREFVKSLAEMKPTMKEYMTPSEVGGTVENWLRGLLEFRAKYSEDVDLLNLTKEGLEQQIDLAQVEGLIGEEKNENIKRDMFAPSGLLKLDKSSWFFNHQHLPGKLIWGIYNSWDSLKDSIKNLQWGQGIWAFLKELLKQMFTFPK